jgi:hypothetical protein
MSGNQTDPLDMTDQYNTPLTPEGEAQYQQWLAQQSQAAGRDMSRDTYDYDMRGAFLGGAGRAGNGHYPDTYKKPNHPSFSDQSQYHGADGHLGGAWSQAPNGAWRFAPGPTNLQMHGPAGLQNYFQRGDPNVIQDLPPAPAPTPAPATPVAPLSMLDYVRQSMARSS